MTARNQRNESSVDRQQYSDDRDEDKVSLAVIQNDLKHLRGDVSDVKSMVQNRLVTREEFEPVKKVVYGLVSVILLTVAGAALTFLVRT